MAGPLADGTRPVIAEWLQRQRALWLLLGDASYRRAGYRLTWYTLRGWLRGPLVGASLALAVFFGVMAEGWFATASAAWGGLELVLLAGATVLGAALYRTEQTAGTLELVWLASGSERALLRLRMVGAMVALGVLVLPSAVVLWFFLDGALQLGHVLTHGLVLGFFLLSTLALAGTFLPQAWAAGVAMAVIHGGLYLGLQGSASILNPFLDPWSPAVGSSALLASRILQAGLGLILLRMTAARLRRAL